MTSEPDLTRDMDALFRHMKENLDWDPDEPLVWHFTFRDANARTLETFGETLDESFSLSLQETVETIEDGKVFDGPPMLSVSMTGVFTVETIKANHDRFEKLAAEKQIEYEGVSCYETFDEEEMFGWMDLEDATWRLRSFADTGLEPGEAVPFVFAVEPADQTVVDNLVTEFEERGLGRTEHLSDDEGKVVVVLIDGANDESVLTEAFAKVGAVAESHSAELLGVQFMDLEEQELEDESAG